MKTILKLLLILTILSTSVNSIVAATTLKKGEITPYSGILFNKTEEKQLRKNNEERKLLEKLTFKQKELISNQKEQIGVMRGKLSKRNVSGLVKTLYFVGGVLSTGISVYLAGKLVRR